MYVMKQQFDKALPMLHNAVTLAGDYVDALLLHNYCLVYNRMGRCKEAIECNKRLVQLFPLARNFQALGVSASVCSYSDPLGISAKLQANILVGAEQKNDACPHGYTLQLSYDSAGVTSIIQTGGAIYPDFPIPEHLHYFTEHQIAIVHLQNVLLESSSGVISKSCEVFTGDHLFLAKMSDFHGVNPTDITHVIPTPVASVLQQLAANYYHCMAEIFGRLLVLRDNIFVNGNEHGITTILVPSAGKPLLQQVLQMINAQNAQVIVFWNVY